VKLDRLGLAAAIVLCASGPALTVFGPAQGRRPDLELGREVRIVLDDEDRAEAEYGFVLREPRGIYRLTLKLIAGGCPGVSIARTTDGEAIDCEPCLLEKPDVILTLEAGAYVLTASNDPEAPELSLALSLAFLRSWTEEDEWEPNDEPRQILKPGGVLRGRLQGSDEDRYWVDVSGGGLPAFDFTLEAASGERMILRIAENGREEEACRVGVSGAAAPAIRGLMLPPGRYILSIGRLPSFDYEAGKPPPFSSPEYALRIATAAVAGQRLVPEDEAMQGLFSPGEDGRPRLEPSPRMLLEEKIRNLTAGHGSDLLAAHRKGRPFGEGSPSDLLREARQAIAETAFGALDPQLERLAKDATIRGALVRWRRMLGPLTQEKARALAGLWPQWSSLPEEWAAAIVDGPAARRLRSIVLRSRRLLDIQLLTSEGFLAGSAGVPESFRDADGAAFKKWLESGKKRTALEARFEPSSGLWVQQVAVPVLKDDGEAEGVLIVTVVIGVSSGASGPRG